MKPHSRQVFSIFKVARDFKRWLSICLLGYLSLLKSHPLVAKSVTSGVISALGEVLGAVLKHHRLSSDDNTSDRRILSYLRAIDIRRVIMFGAYGTVVTGPIFHYWYSFLQRFVSRQSLSLPASISLQLGLNQVVLTPPFLALTLYYLNFAQSFNHEVSVRALKNTFAVALYTNWKVPYEH